MTEDEIKQFAINQATHDFNKGKYRLLRTNKDGNRTLLDKQLWESHKIKFYHFSYSVLGKQTHILRVNYNEQMKQLLKEKFKEIEF